ncbi:MAG TPA: GT-D fold domain-containing glycosyltransferase [Pyrinomonadaceae bacterium]|nr:GT-D fold domain-containing glycosyltransferase [Pyrinomonadaceae bacterium]
MRHQKSISRFGDGELKLMLKQGNIVFQAESQQLSQRLKEVLNSDLPNLIIALPGPLCSVRKEILSSKLFWLRFINSYGNLLSAYLDQNRVYGNAGISRFYLGLTDKRLSAQILEQLKRIWDKKEVLIVEGEFSRMGVGNDLFDNAAGLGRLVCPAADAFSKYEEILAAAKKYGQDKLILVALGPTATILSHDLAQNGYWAIDIGHVDVEYMWMLSNAQSKTLVKGRSVCEIKGEQDLQIPEAYQDEYYKSIIDTIGSCELVDRP